MRRPSILEILGQLVLLTIFVALLADLVSALDALPCSHPDAGHDCYPWGTEAAGGGWHYLSKEIYAGSALVQLIGLPIAALAPFKTSNPRSGLLAMTLIGLSGFLLVPGIGVFL